ncbi:hypothetical protein DFQ27_008217, partial [Actinomortierella ambigua]
TLVTLLASPAKPTWPFPKQDISMVVNMRINTSDVAMSSWVKLRCYHWDFHLGLGLPVAVRRPNWTPEIEGLLFLLPRTVEGDIAVGVCLREEDLERLKADPVFTRYGRFIG